MKYQVRKGIVLQNVCRENLLIATGEAKGVCPDVKQINAGGAYYWKLLCQGTEPEKMLELAAAEYHTDTETLRPGLERFLKVLVERNYLLTGE